MGDSLLDEEDPETGTSDEKKGEETGGAIIVYGPVQGLGLVRCM